MEHSISEKDRFNSDANQAGKETANLAMKELSIALKNIYMKI